MGKYCMCKRCGNHRHVNLLSHIISLIAYQEMDDVCRCCGFKMTKMPDEIRKKYKCFALGADNLSEEYDREQARFVEEYASKFPEFDNVAYQNRLKKHEEFKQRCKQREEQKRMQYQSQSYYTPKCPICGSPDISKITVTTRVAKTATFGTLGALDDAGKTWKCNKCGSKF